jgi:hypothetical protein
MKHLTALSASLVLAAALHAQPAAELKQAYTGIKNNLTRAAEKMPEDSYDFKASPDIRTFGALIGHIADSQMRTCSGVNGEMKQGTAASKTSKADLVAALKASFEACDAAYNNLTDANAGDMLKGPRGERSRIGTLVGVVVHGNEEYGYLAVYMRLKSVVPPSSDRSR